MTDPVELLLTEQSVTIAALRRQHINFKKLARVNHTPAKLNNRLETIKELWATCRSLHVRLLHATTEEVRSQLPYFTEDQFSIAEDQQESTADLIAEAIAKLSNATAGSHNLSSESQDSAPRRAIQLPRIAIPKFSGKVTEWENFKGIFESLVSRNDLLTNSEKLHYLKANVSGDAALVIANVQISDENYTSAWQLLKDEYDDRYTLIHAHIHAFAELPVMRAENVSDLRKLRDTFAASLAALEGLNRPVDSWDDLLVYWIAHKFSQRTKSEWNLKRSTLSDCPTYRDIYEFMSLRIRGLTDLSSAHEAANSNPRNGKSRGSVHSVSAQKCAECSGTHLLSKCDAFLNRSIDHRISFVKQHQLCYNCLRKGHASSACPSKGRCFHCRRAHHTVLHKMSPDIARDKTPASASPTEVSEVSTQSTPPPTATVHSVQPQACAPANILLATAWVLLRTPEGRTTQVRALLDQGSTSSFISESLCQTLRTRRQRVNLQIQCFGEKYSGSARSRVKVYVSSVDDPRRSVALWAYAYEKITSYASSQFKPVESWPHLRGLKLADPDPSGRHPIHLLIGADLYGSLLLGDIRKGPMGTPTAQSTILGWILSGPSGSQPSSHASVAIHNCVAQDDLCQLLQTFWLDETVPSETAPLTADEQRCEQHFAATHERNEHGRYVVRLPFKSGPPPDIGKSYDITLTLHSKMAKRLSSKPDLSAQYNDFLAEYEQLGHMVQVNPSIPTGPTPVYIPHPAVLKEGNHATKLRVVFNASCGTSNGTSLNDHLLIGPKLQQDLAAIILRWRQHQYVYTADITKMYRQILVHPDDVNYQRILWQPADCTTINHYALLTVTYGTACAPYLAMRVLHQLARDEGAPFPLAVAVFQESIYVDDALFGADEIEDVIQTREQLTALMKCGQFELRKWTSNVPELIIDIPVDMRENSDHLIQRDESLKILGLSWKPSVDSFVFKVSRDIPVEPTKRSVSSMIARLFDPLGWASPVVISAKILLQELWLANVGWDDPLPPDVCKQWTNYYNELTELELVQLPRWTGLHRDALAIELHGFADASTRAYAAAVYLRVQKPTNEVRVTLLCAKTKVAPLKTLSVPRLELNAAVLLSRLIGWTCRSLRLSAVPVHGWTDSTVTLAWITQHPAKWRIYVANRVSEIQTTVPNIHWHHVSSSDNPADCASRGLAASSFVQFQLWFSGPPWLQKPPSMWPQSQAVPDLAKRTAFEESASAAVHHVEVTPDWELLHNASTWTRLTRVTAYVRRFVANIRRRLNARPVTSASLETDELIHAENFWLAYAQGRVFPSELKALQSGVPISSASRLRSFNPFLGDDNLIRLGGRLINAPLTYSECHPVLLADHRVVQLLIGYAHQITLHGGTQLTLRILRQKYWILSARNQVKKYIQHCVVCARHRAATQQLGNLPVHRVTPATPFSVIGVDYAGPMLLTPRVSRGQKTTKHYVAVFVCFATKAIHLECVDDYSTAGFLAAFARFTSRRGLPAHIYSDNGTNFQGADNELRRAFRSVIQDPLLAERLASDHVTWHFNPPASPHFGRQPSRASSIT